MAIADNDLTKVNRSAKAAGVSVLYPYLTPDLIEFMGRMPSHLKVNRTIKRYLFKKATTPAPAGRHPQEEEAGVRPPLRLLVSP